MASTNKTPNLGLNLWLGTDKPEREDFNRDNQHLDDMAGEIAKPPEIRDGVWWEYDFAAKEYVSTGVDAQGWPGPQGEQGPQGKGITVSGIYSTLDDLQAAHPTGNAGDAYAVGSPSDNVVYIWDTERLDWSNIGTLRGPVGPAGSALSDEYGNAINALKLGGTDADRYFQYSVSDGAGPTISITDLPDGAKPMVKVYGKTVETGTGDKSPDNPYTLTGAGESGTVPIVVSDGTNSQTVNVPMSAPLYSLPNGVRDEVDVTAGKITRRNILRVVGEGDVVQWSLYNADTNSIHLAVYSIGVLGVPAEYNVVSDKIPVNTHASRLPRVTIDTVGRIYFGWIPNEWVGVTQDDTMSEANAKLEAWLSLNPITVLYELAEPIIETIPPIDIPLYYPDCTITTTDENEPDLEVTVLNPKPVSDSLQLGGRMAGEYALKSDSLSKSSTESQTMSGALVAGGTQALDIPQVRNIVFGYEEPVELEPGTMFFLLEGVEE